ncbi:MAG: OmpA family protein [Pseudomonadota bacterium]
MKNNKCALAIFASSLAISASFAQAAPESGVYHAYMGALFGQPDNQRPLVGNSTGFIGAIGIPLFQDSNRWHVEIAGTNQTFKTPANVSTSFFRQDLTASLMYSFEDRDVLTPYVLAGVGVARNDVIPDDLDKTGFTGHVGVGLTKLFGFAVRGRLEVRGIYDDYSEDYVDTAITTGIEIPLGRTQRVEVEVIKVVQAQPVIIEKPVEVQVIKETLKEVPPPDSDGDNIADSIDRCPGTLANVRTDNLGCAISQTVVLENIEFDFNQDTLKSSSKALIEKASVFFSNQANLRAVVAGHTDSIGSNDANQTLSVRRANTVRNALVAGGVDGLRLQAIGLGETLPIATNDTEAGRANNRRVEFLLVAATAEITQ